MAENKANCSENIREAVCIHTSKIFDACKDKDCIEDLRVYPTGGSQAIIESACSVRPRSARLLYADVKVEEINFNKGCYTVDVTYFYKVTGEAFPGERRVTGLAIFEKRAILYGSEGSSKVFSSSKHCNYSRSGLPTAIVEAVDPIALSMKICEGGFHHECCDDECKEIPCEIAEHFDDTLITHRCQKHLLVTLGQFSIIRLERDTQLLMPAYDYCIPDKECSGGIDIDPCAIFSNIPFPVDDFYPPKGNPDRCVLEKTSQDNCCRK